MNIRKIVLLLAPPILVVAFTGSYTSLSLSVAMLIGSLPFTSIYYLAYWLSNGFSNFGRGQSPLHPKVFDPFDTSIVIGNPHHPLHRTLYPGDHR